jgi:hypothetical protein
MAGDMTIHSVSDRALLALVEDLGMGATTLGIARAIDRPYKNAGARLGAMRRMELVTREPATAEDPDPFWTLTALGKQFRDGHLRAQLNRAMTDVADGELYALLSVIGGRMGSAEQGSRAIYRRELRHHGAIR